LCQRMKRVSGEPVLTQAVAAKAAAATLATRLAEQEAAGRAALAAMSADKTAAFAELEQVTTAQSHSTHQLSARLALCVPSKH